MTNAKDEAASERFKQWWHSLPNSNYCTEAEQDYAHLGYLAGRASKELRLPDHNTEKLKLMKNKCVEDAIKNFTEYANEKVNLSPNEQMMIRFTARNTAGLMRNLLQNYIDRIKALNECEGEK